MNKELLKLAEQINAARIAANGIEETSWQGGVYGTLSQALVDTLELIVGQRAMDAYGVILDGNTVEQAVDYVLG
jgi:hypothetical protein